MPRAAEPCREQMLRQCRVRLEGVSTTHTHTHFRFSLRRPLLRNRKRPSDRRLVPRSRRPQPARPAFPSARSLRRLSPARRAEPVTDLAENSILYFAQGVLKTMPRARRNRNRKPNTVHDRQARDLPRNAEVAAVEVDDPLALEPGEKIVALRSIRNDPLGRLHSPHQIDEAQFRGGRAFQDDWEKAERGPRALDPTREYVDGGGMREP